MMNKLKNYIKIISGIVNKKTKILLVCEMLIIIVLAFLLPIKNLVYSEAVDIIADEFILKSALYLITIYIAVQIIAEIFGYINVFVAEVVELEIERGVSHKINQKLAKIRMEHLEYPKTHDLISRTYSTVKTSLTTAYTLVIAIISPVITLITQSLSLTLIKWYFPILIIILNIPYLIVLVKNNHRTHDTELELAKKERLYDYFISILTKREYTKEVRVYKALDFIFSKIITLKESIVGTYIKLFKTNTRDTIGAIIIQNFAVLTCLLIVAYFVNISSLSIGSFVLTYTVCNQIQTSLTSLISNISSWNNFSINMNDWNDLMNLDDEMNFVDDRMSSANTAICFDDVSFEYPNGNKPAVSNINVTINPKEKVAIIGENGSGKTTFLYLLLGLYKPTKGRIFIGEKELSSILDDYRANTSCLLQNFCQYQMSVLDNINQGQSNEVLDYLPLLNFVESLDHGINTIIGHIDENSRELSGGEWQRIALCRTLNHECIYYVLDEPTASLDPMIKEYIAHKLLIDFHDKTVVVITHDIDMAMKFERILFFSDGEIIADGTPNELNENCPAFQKWAEHNNETGSVAWNV